MGDTQQRLGDILVKKGLISKDELEESLVIQKKTKDFLGKILIKRCLITSSQLAVVFSEQFDLPLVNLKDKFIDWPLIDQFSHSLILEHRCFPLEKRGQVIVLAMTNPLDAWAQSKAQEQARNCQIKRAIISEEEMDEFLVKFEEHSKKRMRRLFNK